MLYRHIGRFDPLNRCPLRPSLANGCMYVGTTDDLLVICLKTGEADASDSHMWGGNAQHNKK